MTILINGKLVTGFTFPGGERQIRAPVGLVEKERVVTAVLKNSNDIMDLLLTADTLTEKTRLILPYLPYARQDRATVPGEARGLKVFADLVNNLGFSTVEVYDPHSLVAENLINNLVVHTQQELFLETVKQDWYSQSVLVSPDAGAEKKVIALNNLISTKHWGLYLKIAFATKKRDPYTGVLSGCQLKPEDFRGRREFFIVDDICDGGATFINLAKEIHQYSPNANLFLYVTHGIFSKGTDELLKHYKRIWCYHTFLEKEQLNDSITVATNFGEPK